LPIFLSLSLSLLWLPAGPSARPRKPGRPRAGSRGHSAELSSGSPLPQAPRAPSATCSVPRLEHEHWTGHRCPHRTQAETERLQLKHLRMRRGRNIGPAVHASWRAGSASRVSGGLRGRRGSPAIGTRRHLQRHAERRRRAKTLPPRAPGLRLACGSRRQALGPFQRRQSREGQVGMESCASGGKGQISLPHMACQNLCSSQVPQSCSLRG